MNTELLFQTSLAVNQLSIYGAVANLCHQFCSTEEEKGRANLSETRRSANGSSRDRCKAV